MVNKDKRKNKESKKIYRKIIFAPPPLIPTVIKKYNIDNDPNFRKQVTEFFLKKIKKWMTNYKSFKHTKKNLKLFNSKEGYNLTYNLLRKYCKMYEIKWYYLRSEHYINVKDFLKFELGKKY